MATPNIGRYYTRDYFKESDKPEVGLHFDFITLNERIKHLKESEKINLSELEKNEIRKKIELLKKQITKIENENTKEVEKRNKILFDFNLHNYKNEIGSSNEHLSHCTKISLKTLYPGLLFGSGYRHETGIQGELKLGMQFDHTTGLPYIPGHSVKGVIKYWLKLEFEDEGKEVLPMIGYFIENELKNTNHQVLIKKNLEALIDKMFPNDERLSIYETDIYYDAILDFNNKKFLSNDFITPHPSPIKEPVPLSFLLIKEDVQFNFYFDLKDTHLAFKDGTQFILTKTAKKNIFKTILTEFGIGAKTSVGYGMLTDNLLVYNNVRIPYTEFKAPERKFPQNKDRRDQYENKQKNHDDHFDIGGKEEQQKHEAKPGFTKLKLLPEWPSVQDVTVNSLVRAIVLSAHEGNAKLQLYFRDKECKCNLQANAVQGNEIELRVAEISGRRGTDNYTVTKVKINY